MRHAGSAPAPLFWVSNTASCHHLHHSTNLMSTLVTKARTCSGVPMRRPTTRSRTSCRWRFVQELGFPWNDVRCVLDPFPKQTETMKSTYLIAIVFLSTMFSPSASIVSAEVTTLKQRLSNTPYQLIYETYNKDNWDLAVVRADGSGQVNLTNSPGVHELYPQASPDGTRICFLVESGSGRSTMRSVWVMDIDGKNRMQIAENARQPFWSPDSKTVCYLPQEFSKFNVADYFTKGLNFYELDTGNTRQHANSRRLHHLYNPHFAANGKWIAATVHAGMGYGHTNILVEANGDRIINLGERAAAELSKGEKQEFGGCRPCISPDNKLIAWGRTDHDICVAELDLNAAEPYVGKLITTINDPVNKIYHVDWSPDGQFLSISRGPKSNGDISKPGTHEAACEMVGSYAKDWDLVAVPATEHTRIELQTADDTMFHQLTHDGQSNKESDWFQPAETR